MTRHPMFGILLATAASLLLTPDTLFMRWSGMDGMQMLAWRGTLMGAVLLATWALTGRNRRADLAAMAGGAALAIIACQFVNATLFAHAIASAPVPVVLFAVACAPVFSALFARLLLGEPTRPATWIAIVAVLTGIGIAVFGRSEGELALDARALRGALMGLGVATILALNFNLVRRHASVPLMPCMGVGALAAGLVAWAVAGSTALEGNIAAIAVTGAVILPVSFFALSLASRYTHASNVSLLMLLETILGPVWLWVGLNEVPTPAMLLGGTIVVISLALYILQTGRRQRRARRAGAQGA